MRFSSISPGAFIALLEGDKECFFMPEKSLLHLFTSVIWLDAQKDKVPFPSEDSFILSEAPLMSSGMQNKLFL